MIERGGRPVTLNSAPRHLSVDDLLLCVSQCCCATLPSAGKPGRKQEGVREAHSYLPLLKSMPVLDTGGSWLSDGTGEPPLGVLEGHGSLLDVLF